MSQRSHRSELGRLVQTHRPVGRLLGWGVILVICVPFALIPVLAAPNSLGLVAGLVVFVVLALSFTYGLGEWLFLQHLLYEHGTVLRSLPGLRTFVIPHYTVDPSTIHVAGRRVHDGGAVTAVQVGRVGSFRVTPLAARTVRFDALHPMFTRQLAKGKLDWQTAGVDDEVRDRQQVWVPRRSLTWALSHQAADGFAQLMHATVVASQQVRPYYRADQTP